MAVEMTMSAEEFRTLPPTQQIMEHIHGAIIVSPSPTSTHQQVTGNGYFLLRQLVPGGTVLIAPMDLYLGDETVQPDVFWAYDTCQSTPDEKWQGPPHLIIEVLSPSTAQHDRPEGLKFRLYEQHGIGEYWVADPVHRSLDVFALQDGRYTLQGIYWPGDSFESVTLKQTVVVSRLFD